MTRSHTVKISQAQFDTLMAHLLPQPVVAEEVAFLCAKPAVGRRRGALDVCELILVDPAQFRHRGLFHLQIGHEVLGHAIKRAHDLEASLIEVHSHPFPGMRAARFSQSDRAGLAEIVPHVRWRLPGRPYGALVVAPDGIDGLVWTDHFPGPEQVDAVAVDGRRRATSGLSLPSWRRDGSV